MFDVEYEIINYHELTEGHHVQRLNDLDLP